MRYSAAAFERALPQMLQVAPALRASETYRYDLVDIARQTLANESRVLLPRIKGAYEDKDRPRFEALTQCWLGLMDLAGQTARQRPVLSARQLAGPGSALGILARRAGAPRVRRALPPHHLGRSASERARAAYTITATRTGPD